MRSRNMVVSLTVFNLGIVLLAALIIVVLGYGDSLGETETSAVTASVSSVTQKWGFIAAALAVGLSSLGAAIAVATVGSSAMGAMSEKPELGGRALIFLGLAEGIAIYGLIIAIMILGKF